jgi:flavin-binding protein dodecin
MVEKTILLTGTSPNGIEEAIELVTARAAVTIEGLRRARVSDVRMELGADGKVARWVVDVEATFEIKEHIHG